MTKQSIVVMTALAWLILEMLTYVWFLKQFGLVASATVGMTSLLLGLAALRSMGNEMIRRLRENGLATYRGFPVRALIGGCGAVLLILPGFLTDMIGCLCLCAYVLLPKASRKAFKGVGDTIELTPDQWSRVRETPADGNR